MKTLALKATAVSLLITVCLAISIVVLPASALAAFTWADLGTTSNTINGLIHVAENNTLYAACSTEMSTPKPCLPAAGRRAARRVLR